MRRRCVGCPAAVPRLSRGCPAAVPRRSRRSPGLYSCLRRCLPCRIQEQYAACRSGPHYRHHPYSSEPAGLLRPYHHRHHHHDFHCHPHTELPGPRRPRRCVHASLSKTNLKSKAIRPIHNFVLLGFGLPRGLSGRRRGHLSGLGATWGHSTGKLEATLKDCLQS